MIDDLLPMTNVFAIELKQKQYKTYILSDETANSALEVVPERGGIAISWLVEGKEMFYLDAERFANPDLTVRGGIPILFPICSNLPDNTYTHKGVERKLKQHGFARDLPWTATEQVTDGCAAITLVLNSDEKTQAVYPFDFQVAFTYQIKGNSLEIVQEYTNMGTEPMPFSSGLHPYFLAPDKTNLRFEIPGMQYRDQKTHSKGYFTGVFDPALDEIHVSFDELTGLAAIVTDAARNLRLTLSYSSSYGKLVFWMVEGKDFYCLEPWTAPRNALNTGEHLIYLQPGATCQMLVRMTATFF
ncbi:aldose epimerase [Tychonema sp. LEGE 07203]|uniref:aldose epimerase family protein n=1 Tax=Tychonema sp. LEGE 07203 TaxID=1828671 RepID=UPI00187FED99|nr:aldose epimerase [Tychonema sp. LEGE 07203]MBE9093378.1 aldose epimerase [Tychonema sp. LEGE 07203]